MAIEGSIFDGFTTIVAQDADTHPSFLPPGYVAESVNRSFRGGINRTRPAFNNIELKAGAGQPETIVNDIRTANFQGASEYRSVKSLSPDGIVVSAGGVIYFIQIVGNTGYVYFLIDGNDPTLMHTWFCQAEDWIYIQNGYQNAIAWDGILANPPIRLNPYQRKMPIGTIMCYAFGRVFVSDKFNQITASDIIFGNGFTDTTNTQNFTETEYWMEGGAFTTPASLGNITSMEVMPVIGTNSRGQGELVVLCENGAFSLNVSIPRLEWKDAQIQRISMVGRGCESPYSSLVNGELWFRSSDGWAFYSNTQGDFNKYFVLRKLSREVGKWVSQDTPWLRQFASSIFFDNYVFSTVAPRTQRTEDGNALHRYHDGIVVLDLDMSSSPAPDASVAFRWNGLWTGVRPTKMVSATIGNDPRAFVFSFDRDGVNRLYEFSGKYGNDYGENGFSQIKSFFITGRYDFTSSQQTNKFLRKGLRGGEMWISEIFGQGKVSAEYRSDSSICWNELQPEVTLGCDDCNPLQDGECTLLGSLPRYKCLIIGTPDSKACNEVADIPAVEGSEFQIKVNLSGTVTVDRLRIMANLKSNASSPVGACLTEEDKTCIPSHCCPVEYFAYSII